MLTTRAHRTATTTATATAALVAALLVLACLFAATAPQQAFADVRTKSDPALTAAATSTPKNTVVKLTTKEKKAYKRVLAAVMDYENQPNPITVDVSDLGLTSAQALHVGYLLHGNGELFWINTYNDSSYGKKTFSLPCYYDDATITKMRKQLDAAAAKALKRIGPGMSDALKVHMLHDYVLDRVDYKAGKKDAYEGLVNGVGDCFGFALTMDFVLRRAGFSTDMAFNSSIDHSWNLVKVGSYWYHIDTTWDNGYCDAFISDGFDWTGKRCHLYLLQSDASMNAKSVDPLTGTSIQSHAGWTCHHVCKSKKYDSMYLRAANSNSAQKYKDMYLAGTSTFTQNCKAYKSIVRSFNRSGLKYTVTDVKTVWVKSVSSSTLRKKALITIPSTVTYKGVTYKVAGISPKAFANAKAKTLKVYTAKLSKARVKNSLSGSKVKKIRLFGSAKAKKATYKKYFTKKNAGRAATVVKG